MKLSPERRSDIRIGIPVIGVTALAAASILIIPGIITPNECDSLTIKHESKTAIVANISFDTAGRTSFPATISYGDGEQTEIVINPAEPIIEQPHTYAQAGRSYNFKVTTEQLGAAVCKDVINTGNGL